MAEKEKKSKYLAQVGGQALLEGIMMQSPNGAAIAVRRADGKIIARPKTVKHARDKFKPLGWPVIRGIVNFVESMIFGYNCMMESAELSGQLEVEESEENMSKLDKWLDEHFGPKMVAVVGVIGMVLGFALAFLLFVWLPTFLVDKILPMESAQRFHPLCEGVIRIFVFVMYIVIVGMQKDIKRTFMYHGAEHKSIFCLEAGDPLTVENVRKNRRFHPRCGTSFIFVVLILSILISSAVTLIKPDIGSNRAVWIAIKLCIAPLVMGIGYEFIKYAGKHENILTKILSAPGLWMQRVTTKEPSDDIIEVGITSLVASLYGIGSDEFRNLPFDIDYDACAEKEEDKKEKNDDENE